MASKISYPGSAQAADGRSVAVMLGYSAGNLGKSIVWTSFEAFLLFYLVTVAGFSPILAGCLLAGSMVWDACMDVLVSYLTDRHGRSHALTRLILAGAPLGGFAFALIFAIPADRQMAVIGACLLCRICYTFCDIGHNTLMVRVVARPQDAATVSGLRLVFSAMGAGLVGLASAHILSFADRAEQQAAFAQWAVLGGSLYCAALFVALCASGNLPAPPADRRCWKMAGVIATLWCNRAYRQVLCLIAIQASLIPLFVRALPFFGRAVEGDAAWSGWALTVVTLAQALSLPVWIGVSRWLRAVSTLALAYGSMGVAIVMMAGQIHGGVGALPLVLVGVSQAGMNLAIWAMLALSVREGAANGRELEALPVGLFLATLKGSAGIGNAMLATTVNMVDWWSPSVIGHSRTPILVISLGLPLLGCLLGIIATWLFRLRSPFWQ